MAYSCQREKRAEMRLGQIVRDKQDDINMREILRPGPKHEAILAFDLSVSIPLPPRFRPQQRASPCPYTAYTGYCGHNL